MSITLRRKMFKLGGPTNTHGIGITSGLDFNRKKFAQGGGNRDGVGQTTMRAILPETGELQKGMGFERWMKNRAIQNSMLDQGFKPYGDVQIAGNSGIQSANQRALADAKRIFFEEGEAPPPVYWNDNYDRVHGFKKGGYVPQRVGHQPQDHPHRQGDREGHLGPAGLIPLLIRGLTMGARYLPAWGRAATGKGLGSIKNMVLGDATGAATKAGMGFGRGFNPVTGRIKDVIVTPGTKGRWVKNKKTGKKEYVPGKEAVKKDMNRKEYMEFLKKNKPEKFKEMFGDYGLGKFGRTSQVMRGIGAGMMPATGLGLVSSMFPEYDQTEDTPMLANAADTIFRELPEGISDMATSIPTGVLGALGGQGLSGFKGLGQVMQDALHGDKVTPKDQIESQEDAYEEMTEEGEAQAKEAIDEYYRLMSGQTKKQETLNLAGKVISGVAPQIDSGDYAGAAQEGANIMAQEADEKKAMRQQAAGVYLGEKMESDRLSDATVAELIAAGDVDGALEAERIMSAANDSGGMQNVQKLPVKADGKIATESLKAGVIYTDVSNATGGLYVVFAEDGEPIVTNSYTEARNAASAAA